MNRYVFLLCALIGHSTHAQKKIIAFNPQDCTNCLKGIEFFTDKNTATYIFQEEYSIDSNTLREKYVFSENAHLIFSNALFKKYTLDGRSTISSKNALLKCNGALFDKKASEVFSKLTSDKKLDTLTFVFPISKSSFNKRIFLEDGKVYLRDMLAHNVILFDILHDRPLDTFNIDMLDTKKAYELFSLEDTTAYDYYKSGMAKITHDDIASIKDFSIVNDTLYLSISNNYFFVGGANQNDTFITKFESIGLYKDGKYIKTIVPDNIDAKLLNKNKLFTSEAQDIYYNDNRFYTSIYNGKFYNGSEYFALGCYSPSNSKYEWVITLNSKYYTDYNFSNTIFNNKHFFFSKSSELFSVDSGLVTDLKYFDQGEFEHNGIQKYPKYLNRDSNIDDQNYNVLYYSNLEKVFYYARIDRKRNKSITTQKLLAFDGMYVLIDPYNNNYILAFMHPNKVIRMKVFDD